jgi:uncharacterized protein (DUF1330 family)
MPAYVICDIEVLDAEKYEEYKKLGGASAAEFGGRYIVRGGAVTPLEGEWAPKRLVVIEFPSVEKAKAWWDSPAYGKAKKIRHATARSKFLIVEGS